MKWTTTQILTCGARSVRWPNSTTGPWPTLHECVDSIHCLLNLMNERMDAIENDQDLSPQGRERRRAELAIDALKELAKFKELSKAQDAVARRIAAVKSKMTGLPAAPSTEADIALAAEIRRSISAEKDPVQFAWKHLHDPRVVGALIHAPSFLSGLKDEDVANIETAAIAKLHPDQVKEITELQSAEETCRDAIHVAQNRIAERANVRRYSDGQWRHISEKPGLETVA